MPLENGCACGKKEMDGVRCRLGATHKPLTAEKHAFPWEQKKEVMPWETTNQKTIIFKVE
jgi:hypothetical protein